MKKTGASSADQEMPEVNLKRARILGVGEYFRRMAAEQHYVQLDTDVARDFRTSEEVNEALRLVQRMREIGKSAKRKKFA